MSLLKTAGGSPVGGAQIKDASGDALLQMDEQATTWHQNVQASLETMALASNTGLIAALSAPDWGVEGAVIDLMRNIVQVTIMANYLVKNDSLSDYLTI